MRKTLIILAVALCAFFAVSGYAKKDDGQTAELYFVDSSMQRLIPSDFEIDTSDPEKAAEKVIDELISGRDENPKIMRIIPNIKDGLSVKVEDETAYVNMTGEFVNAHSDLRQHELLTIYQIVNSLTSLDGIVTVKFTIDNEVKKDFKGFCDMRETFIPDYYI